MNEATGNGRWGGRPFRPLAGGALLFAALLGSLCLCSTPCSAQQAPPDEGFSTPLLPTYSRIIELGRMEENGRITIFYRVGDHHAKAYKPVLEKYINEGEGDYVHTSGPPQHLLILCTSRERFAKIEEVLSLLSVPQKQVWLEVRVVETTAGSDLQLGVEFLYNQREHGTIFEAFQETFNPEAFLRDPTNFQGATFSFFSTGHIKGTFDLKLRMLLERGQARIISNPRLMVESGKEASIEWGDTLYIQTFQEIPNANPIVAFQKTDFKNLLKIKPHVIGNEHLELNIDTQLQEIVSFQTIQQVQVPMVSFRTAKTEVTVRDGDRIVIAGLVKETSLERERGLPLLMDIPLLGNLFKMTREELTKTEILVIIEPTIVDQPGLYSQRLLIPEPPVASPAEDD